jgi:hypothetical protein
MTLNELMGDGGPISALLNGMPFHDAPATEFPTLGATEMWEVVNLTGDAHPIHLHLVQFQLLNRQKINVKRYQIAFDDANPTLPSTTYTPVPVEPYLRGKPVPADANERGWKDTYRMNPGEVTRILVRFAPQDESPAFAFDATAEPGYVWHCHILEHEENDMMRPYHLVASIPELDAQPAERTETSPMGLTRFESPSPNPAFAGGSLRFSLRNTGPVEIDLYTIAGQHVGRLASGQFSAGEHTVAWRPVDKNGTTLATGVYLVRFRGDGITRSQKLVVSR